MDLVAEQYVAIKYCIRHDKTAINTFQIKGSIRRQMLGQIDSVEMAYNIRERPEHGTCVHSFHINT